MAILHVNRCYSAAAFRGLFDVSGAFTGRGQSALAY